MNPLRLPLRTLSLVAMGLLMAAGAACSDDPQARAEDPHAHEHGEEHAELAPFMGELQRFSQKLGYSIEGENAELAGFYLHELEEVFAELAEEVPEHDGHDIATFVQAMGLPPVEAVERAVESRDWPAAWQSYEALIGNCNACHAATEHAFIQITPASGEPPFNQLFQVEAE